MRALRQLRRSRNLFEGLMLSKRGPNVFHAAAQQRWCCTTSSAFPVESVRIRARQLLTDREAYIWLRQALSVRCYSSMPPSAVLNGADTALSSGVSLEEDTIVALSSGGGRSAVAVTRVSGPQADKALLAMLKRGAELPQARQAALRTLHDPQSGEQLDTALILRFPAPNSFTGEDVVEIQGHGGPAVTRALLSGLTSIPGLRLAQAGEFTRRAFLGGKLDLTEVEGIADLLAAETAAQHRQALQQTSGLQRRQYKKWRATLLRCLAHVEAVLDFGDDNDIDSGIAAEILPVAQGLRTELEAHLRQAKAGELIRDGIKVALIGPPNAGKSTILNSLAGREAAIVSPIPGTTRDAVEVVLDLAGQKVIVTDTAGLRETQDSIEAEGVARAKKAAEDANIVIAVADVSAPEHDARLLELASSLVRLTEYADKDALGSASSEPLGGNSRLSIGWSESGSEEAMHSESNGTESFPSAEPSRSTKDAPPPVLLVFNKCDLADLRPFREIVDKGGLPEPAGSGHTAGGTKQEALWLQNRFKPEVLVDSRGTPAEAPKAEKKRAHLARQSLSKDYMAEIVGISAQSGAGMELLLSALERRIATALSSNENSAEGQIITRLRHRRHVQECVEALKGYEAIHEQLDLASEELRCAAQALGHVTGKIGIEHVLDAVFSEFCVGK